jgi:hypothetical protein
MPALPPSPILASRWAGLRFAPDSEKILAIPITPGDNQEASVASLRPR